MSEHFNKLTPAQAERLAMLAEECAEVIQCVTKILRHGYGSYHPDDAERTTNRQSLERELADLWAIADRMEKVSDICTLITSPDKIWARKLRWTHHQGERHE